MLEPKQRVRARFMFLPRRRYSSPRGRLKGHRASHGEDFAGKADPIVAKPSLHCGAQSQSDGYVYPCLTWMPGLDSGCT